MKEKKIKIGLDFDGVVAYNPFRVVRAPVAWFKTHILGICRLSFFVPKHRHEELFWIIVHESSVFPAIGATLLKTLAKRNDMEFHLITARFSFLSSNLHRWLRRFGMNTLFVSVNENNFNIQPHEHKLACIQRLKLDYFVEDNWDIVKYLRGKTKTKIFWIYNVTDRGKEYPYKFPYLQKALEAIIDDTTR